ncbi:hypothetical protein DZC73_02405 [Albitalea terrae]|uniref:Uncharacterized protein n=1 Tax=Piscinibacter terrae TaxID=2496871 RepID=A0A3N7K4T6_9BURK|nr:hypothetical protein DZC73_02405 [Albitalea terrae]
MRSKSWSRFFVVAPLLFSVLAGGACMALAGQQAPGVVITMLLLTCGGTCSWNIWRNERR